MENTVVIMGLMKHIVVYFKTVGTLFIPQLDFRGDSSYRIIKSFVKAVLGPDNLSGNSNTG